jgi:hypothetical protein
MNSDFEIQLFSYHARKLCNLENVSQTLVRENGNLTNSENEPQRSWLKQASVLS